MAEAAANPQSAALGRPPAAPLFAATLAFCGGIILQNFCYKPPSLYLLCTAGFALCSLSALRYLRGPRGPILAYLAAVLAFFPAGALLTAAHPAPTAPAAGGPSVGPYPTGRQRTAAQGTPTGAGTPTQDRVLRKRDG